MTDAPPPKSAQSPAYGAEPQGVAGWLGVLVLSLAFFLPGLEVVVGLRLYGQPGVLPEDMFRALELVQWSAAAATTALCWFLAWRLARRLVWRSVEVTIAGLWIYASLVKGGQFLAVSIVTGIPLQMLAQSGTNLTLPLLFAFAWTVYLLRARRVAGTYPRPPARAKAFE